MDWMWDRIDALPAAVVAELQATTAADEHESWSAKARRARLAVRIAGIACSEHLVALDPEVHGMPWPAAQS